MTKVPWYSRQKETIRTRNAFVRVFGRYSYSWCQCYFVLIMKIVRIHKINYNEIWKITFPPKHTVYINSEFHLSSSLNIHRKFPFMPWIFQGKELIPRYHPSRIIEWIPRGDISLAIYEVNKFALNKKKESTLLCLLSASVTCKFVTCTLVKSSGTPKQETLQGRRETPFACNVSCEVY